MKARKTTVVLSRNGATVQVEDVPSGETEKVMAGLLQMYRRLSKRFPELVVELGHIPGGTVATSVMDDEWAEEGRVGFKTSALSPKRR